MPVGEEEREKEREREKKKKVRDLHQELRLSHYILK